MYAFRTIIQSNDYALDQANSLGFNDYQDAYDYGTRLLATYTDDPRPYVAVLNSFNGVETRIQPDHCQHGNPEHDYCPICDDPPATPEPVDLFERGGGWVASGSAEQWSTTHNALMAYTGTLFSKLLGCHYMDPDVNLEATVRRAERLTDQAFNAIFAADQWGRMSIELFATEAEIIRSARRQEVTA